MHRPAAACTLRPAAPRRLATRWPLGLCVLASLLAAVGPGCTSAPARPADIAALERARFAAMTRQDVAALEPLLAEDLRYCHSNGLCESRAEFLESIGSGSIRYRRIEVLELQPRPAGDAVIVHGTIAVEGEIGGRAARMRLLFTDVYVRREGRWQLAAWQSTRLPE